MINDKWWITPLPQREPKAVDGGGGRMGVDCGGLGPGARDHSQPLVVESSHVHLVKFCWSRFWNYFLSKRGGEYASSLWFWIWLPRFQGRPMLFQRWDRQGSHGWASWTHEPLGPRGSISGPMGPWVLRVHVAFGPLGPTIDYFVAINQLQNLDIRRRQS